MKIALRICVETYRQTREGVPRLLEILQRHKVGASFLFSLGPDHTGRAIRHGFAHESMRNSTSERVLARYGFPTLMYGTALPAPDIGRRCAQTMKDVKAAGFETAIQGWNHHAWLQRIVTANAAWTTAEMQRAHQRYAEVFDCEALGHGAAAWQMNIHALRLTQRLGYRWASDCRGTHPFVPLWNGEPIHCPQLPTTLPTLDELIGNDGHTADNVYQQVLKLTAIEQPAGHVFTVHADLYGGTTATALETLLASWADQAHQICSLGTLRDGLDFASLPRHELVLAAIPGRAGRFLSQGEVFLSSWKDAA